MGPQPWPRQQRSHTIHGLLPVHCSNWSEFRKKNKTKFLLLALTRHGRTCRRGSATLPPSCRAGRWVGCSRCPHLKSPTASAASTRRSRWTPTAGEEKRAQEAEPLQEKAHGQAERPLWTYRRGRRKSQSERPNPWEKSDFSHRHWPQEGSGMSLRVTRGR